YIERFDPDSGAAESLHIWVRDEQGRALRRISAPKAIWHEVSGVGGYDLTNATVESLELTGAGAAAAPAPPIAPVARFETDLDPQRLLLKRYAGFSQCLSSAQIGSMIASPMIDDATRDRLQRARWGRYALMVSNLLSLAITLPFFLLREPKNMVIQSL